MKVLVLGCTGQVGTELMRASWETGTVVTGLSRPHFDFSSPDSMEAALAGREPAIVVNAAAYTAVDKAETEQAHAFVANAHGVELLASACHRHGVPLIHLSTDYVFDGSAAQPYREDDPIGPINVYGRSKAAGEASVRLRQPKHIIVRTAWVYACHGQNFLRTMLRLAAERDELGVVSDQLGTPTEASDIAAALVTIAHRVTRDGGERSDDLWGTYHFTAQGETTWHGFADHIFDHLARAHGRRPRLRAIGTHEYPTPARRPANSCLDCRLIEQKFGIQREHWQDSLDRALGVLVPLGAEVSQVTRGQSA